LQRFAREPESPARRRRKLQSLIESVKKEDDYRRKRSEMEAFSYELAQKSRVFSAFVPLFSPTPRWSCPATRACVFRAATAVSLPEPRPNEERGRVSAVCLHAIGLNRRARSEGCDALARVATANRAGSGEAEDIVAPRFRPIRETRKSRARRRRG
jgi:hypothetical protein